MTTFGHSLKGCFTLSGYPILDGIKVRAFKMPVTALSTYIHGTADWNFEGGEAVRRTRRLLISSYQLPLTLSNAGFLLLVRDVASFFTNSYLNYSELRAKFYSYKLSFFSKNDIKKLLIKKPNFLKLLTSFRDEDTPTDSDLYQNLESLHATSLAAKAPLGGTPHILATSYVDVKFDLYRSQMQYFTYSMPEDIDPGREVLLKRIKFKPGYQRIWRTARTAINYTLNFHCRYQKALTRRLMRLRRLNDLDSLRLGELTLLQTLTNARFTLDLPTSKQLILGQIVFINGVTATNPKTRLFVGDFIQLIVNLRYYIVHK